MQMNTPIARNKQPTRLKFGSLAIALLSTLWASHLVAEEPAFVELRALSPHLAHRMVLAAIEDCAGRGYRVSASVVDRNGNLVAFLRDPLSGPHTIEVSQRKAFTSATTRQSTSQLSSRPDLNFAPGMLLIVGGLPIKFNGRFYGGIAVAGATPGMDEECARSGIKAVSAILNFVE
jgi:uncharacterized protein GlcG (DUF336 family)